MVKETKQKFNVGDKVLDIKDSSEEEHEVLGFSYDGESFTYKVTSKEVDIKEKKIVHGVSFYKEEAIEKVVKK